MNRIRAWWRGVLDGWEQPHELNWSRNLDDLTEPEGWWEYMTYQDYGANLGQVLRKGRKSQAWENGYQPLPGCALTTIALVVVLMVLGWLVGTWMP